MRPLIFLDMDDVLCLDCEFHSGVLFSYFSGDESDTEELWKRLVSAEAAENLRTLHVEFKPLYVLSSSWTLHITREQICEALIRTQLHFVAQNLHDAWQTPRTQSSNRRDEIDWWLQANREHEQPFIIIDDTYSGYTLAGSSFALSGNLILCSAGGQHGFSSWKLDLARRRLQQQLQSDHK